MAAIGVPGWGDPGDRRVRALEEEARAMVVRLGSRPGNGERVKDAIASLVGQALHDGSRRKPKVVVLLDESRERA